jgi:hypothetical protein
MKISRATIIFAVLALFCVSYNILTIGIFVYSGFLFGGLSYLLNIQFVGPIVLMAALVGLVHRTEELKSNALVSVGQASLRRSKFSIALYVYAFFMAGNAIYAWYSSKFASSQFAGQSNIYYTDVLQFGALLINPLMIVIMGFLLQTLLDILSSRLGIQEPTNA